MVTETPYKFRGEIEKYWLCYVDPTTERNKGGIIMEPISETEEGIKERALLLLKKTNRRILTIRGSYIPNILFVISKLAEGR